MKSKLLIMLLSITSLGQASSHMPTLEAFIQTGKLEFDAFIPTMTSFKKAGKKEGQKAATHILSQSMQSLGGVVLETMRGIPQSVINSFTIENYDTYGKRFLDLTISALVIYSLLKDKQDSVKPIIPKGAAKEWAGRLPGNLDKILELKDHAEILAKKGITSPNGYLFHGVPGTGKTLLARVLAEKLQVPLIETNSGEFITMWQGSGNTKLQAILKAAHSCEAQLPFRCIVFIDEIEVIKRGSGNGEEDRLMTGLLAAITDPKNSTILFIGATNYKEKVDPALQREGRLLPIELTLPESSIRKQQIELFLKNSREILNEQDLSMNDLLEKTRNFSSAKLIETMKQVLRSHIITRKTSKTSFSKKLQLFLDGEEAVDLC